MAVKPIPDNYEGVTPYLVIKGAAEAIEFYKNVFGAKELFRLAQPNGAIGHAEIMIGKGVVMLSDEQPGEACHSPSFYGGTPVGLMFYVEDVDTVYQKAIDAGAKVVKPIQDQFYGDRSGTITDPFGYVWTIATHKEDLSPEELNRRAEEWAKKQG